MTFVETPRLVLRKVTEKVFSYFRADLADKEMDRMMLRWPCETEEDIRLGFEWFLYKEERAYVCVDPMGHLLKPNFVTQHFSLLLERNGLKKIRFHDLRHSCASLLYASGVGLKEIQEWLGHSDIGTTSNIYTHLDCNSKRISANAMQASLRFL